MAVSVREIDVEHSADIRLENEPFALEGQLCVSRSEKKWAYRVQRFDTPGEMTFPNENYDFVAMEKEHIFLGAYEGETCVGLAVLRHSWNRYLYLLDLKVASRMRGRGVGRRLIEEAARIALACGYRGVSAIAQDNNLGACLFYLRCGFAIGGLDTRVYTGTGQEGKSDIIFYLDADKGEAKP